MKLGPVATDTWGAFFRAIRKADPLTGIRVVHTRPVETGKLRTSIRYGSYIEQGTRPKVDWHHVPIISEPSEVEPPAATCPYCGRVWRKGARGWDGVTCWDGWQGCGASLIKETGTTVKEADTGGGYFVPPEFRAYLLDGFHQGDGEE